MVGKNEKEMFSDEEYDNDALSLHSASDGGNGSGSEDDLVKHHYRTSRELREHDHGLLNEEDEQVELLRKKGPFDTLKQLFKGAQGDHAIGEMDRRELRRRRQKERTQGSRRRRRQDVSKGEGELMFEMEEGYKDTSSQSETSSIELDRRKWEALEKQPRKPRFRRLALIHVLLLGLFVVFGFGAYLASTAYRTLSPGKSQASHLSLTSNGTNTFRPTTILISLDGFRADFLTRGLTPTLGAFIKQGISPPYMLPSFPSVTFPNHFTFVTGLYPEAHGLVGNTFWDPELEEEFSCSSPYKGCTTPKWWTAEPLWATAEKQKVSTAIHMWPGSEAHIPPIEPTYVDKFNGQEPLPNKVDRILNLIDLPSEEDLSSTPEALIAEDQKFRPQLIAAYVPNVDSDGHNYGPNSTEISSTISQVDTMLSDLFARLGTRNLTSLVNVVVVSDHGMATTSNSRLIQLDDLIDLSRVSHLDGWPLRGLRFHNPSQDLDAAYLKLLSASQVPNSGFKVYLTNSTMPQRYHFTSNPRIAPLWVVPDPGWAIVEREDFDVAEAKANNIVYHPRGLHGYDNEHPLMRAIFVARGPAFPHKPGSRMPVFQNTEVYNIVCDSLGIEPRPNNGTLRLPLKPVGVHGSEDATGGGSVDDLPSYNADTGTPESAVPDDAPTPSDPNSDDKSDADGIKDVQIVDGEVVDGTADTVAPSDNGADGDQIGKAGKLQSWWDLLHEKVDSAKAWAKAWLEHFQGTGELSSDPPMNDGGGNANGKQIRA